MNKRVFNNIGWILLLGMGASWIVFGYSNWYLLFLPVARLSFSIYDGSIRKLKKIARLSMLQIILIVLSFILSVGIAFGLILLANFIINDKLHLQGWIKTLSQIIAVILSLYPVKFTFGSVVYKVISDLNAKDNK